MKINNFLKLVIAVGVLELAGVIGAVFTAPAVRSGWYAGLVKPAFTPPSWIFGPVWIILYALMGVSLWLVWKSVSVKKIKAVLFFAVQLILNAVWSPVFFGFRSAGDALAVIVLLWAAVVITIFVFAEISKPAAYLLAPYIFWVSFAVYLNFFIWLFN